MPIMMESLGVVDSSNKQKLQFKFQLPSPLLPSSSMYIKMLSFYPQLRVVFQFSCLVRSGTSNIPSPPPSQCLFTTSEPGQRLLMVVVMILGSFCLSSELLDRQGGAGGGLLRYCYYCGAPPTGMIQDSWQGKTQCFNPSIHDRLSIIYSIPSPSTYTHIHTHTHTHTQRHTSWDREGRSGWYKCRSQPELVGREGVREGVRDIPDDTGGF